MSKSKRSKQQPKQGQQQASDQKPWQQQRSAGGSTHKDEPMFARSRFLEEVLSEEEQMDHDRSSLPRGNVWTSEPTASEEVNYEPLSDDDCLHEDQEPIVGDQESMEDGEVREKPVEESQRTARARRRKAMELPSEEVADKALGEVQVGLVATQQLVGNLAAELAEMKKTFSLPTMTALLVDALKGSKGAQRVETKEDSDSSLSANAHGKKLTAAMLESTTANKRFRDEDGDSSQKKPSKSRFRSDHQPRKQQQHTRDQHSSTSISSDTETSSSSDSSSASESDNSSIGSSTASSSDSSASSSSTTSSRSSRGKRKSRRLKRAQQAALMASNTSTQLQISLDSLKQRPITKDEVLYFRSNEAYQTRVSDKLHELRRINEMRAEHEAPVPVTTVFLAEAQDALDVYFSRKKWQHWEALKLLQKLSDATGPRKGSEMGTALAEKFRSQLQALIPKDAMPTATIVNCATELKKVMREAHVDEHSKVEAFPLEVFTTVVFKNKVIRFVACMHSSFKEYCQHHKKDLTWAKVQDWLRKYAKSASKAHGKMEKMGLYGSLHPAGDKHDKKKAHQGGSKKNGFKCRGCNNYHDKGATCPHKGKPGYNSDRDIPWDESAIGKQASARGIYKLPLPKILRRLVTVASVRKTMLPQRNVPGIGNVARTRAVARQHPTKGRPIMVSSLLLQQSHLHHLFLPRSLPIPPHLVLEYIF